MKFSIKKIIKILLKFKYYCQEPPPPNFPNEGPDPPPSLSIPNYFSIFFIIAIVLYIGYKFYFLNNKQQTTMKKSILVLFLLSISLTNAQKLFIVNTDNKFGVINEDGVEIIQAKYTSIEEFDKDHVGWAKVNLNEMFGYIEKSGKIIIEPKYDLIYSFNDYRDGWALVVKNGKCGFIDEEGKEIVPTIYDKIEKFGEYSKNFAVIELNGLKGFINTEGSIVLQPKYAEIEKYDIVRKNWALVKDNNGKMGFIDKSCKEVVQVIYDNIEIFNTKK